MSEVMYRNFFFFNEMQLRKIYCIFKKIRVIFIISVLEL